MATARSPSGSKQTSKGRRSMFDAALVQSTEAPQAAPSHIARRMLEVLSRVRQTILFEAGPPHVRTQRVVAETLGGAAAAIQAAPVQRRAPPPPQQTRHRPV